MVYLASSDFTWGVKGPQVVVGGTIEPIGISTLQAPYLTLALLAAISAVYAFRRRIKASA